MGADEFIDSDSDDLSDVTEASSGSNPWDKDTDDDGITDGDEDANHSGIQDPDETDPLDADTDHDGIQDGTERGLTVDGVGTDTDIASFIGDLDPSTQTDPLDWDTDNDDLSDGQEDINANGCVDSGEYDPLNGGDYPYRKGDINKDHYVDLRDIILTLQAIVGIPSPDIRDDYLTAGIDVDGDGMIGLADAIYILKKMTHVN